MTPALNTQAVRGTERRRRWRGETDSEKKKQGTERSQKEEQLKGRQILRD